MGNSTREPDGAAVHSTLSFGEFDLDPRQQQLRRDGRPVALNAQPFKVLLYLASHPDDVVTREALQRHVWGDVLVEYDQGINACIRQIRAALNDDADEPRFIRTLRGTGYRFVAPVRHGSPVAPDAHASTTRVLTWKAIAAVILVIVAGAVWWNLKSPDSPPAAVAAPAASLAESEALRQEALVLLRRANHRPSLDSARRLLNRSTRLAYTSAPPVADWSMALSFAYKESGNDSAATMSQRLLGRAQALDPTGVETALAGGFANLFITHQFDSALVRFRDAVAGDSSRMFAWLGLGLAWRAQGEWGHAIDALSRAARLDTASELAGTELADALFHLRRFHDAHAVAARVKGDPTGAALALLRARLGVVRGNMTAARAALEAAAPLTPDSLLARDPALARIMGRGNEPVQSPLAALIADTLKGPVSNREAVLRQVALAEGLLRAKRLDDAVERLAWLLAVQSPVSLELVERDPLWAAARRTPRYAALQQLWSR